MAGLRRGDRPDGRGLARRRAAGRARRSPRRADPRDLRIRRRRGAEAAPGRVRRGGHHDTRAHADRASGPAARRDRRVGAMIAERRIEVPGGATRVLEVEGPGPEHPVLLFHGNPNSAEDWIPFLERLDGRRHAIAPDLLGWGKADRPASFRWTMESL